MNNSQLMLAAINNGLEDDATTSAALDAIRDESQCSLLAAVLEVARVYKAAREARNITDANQHLQTDSPVREELEAAILAECPNVPTRSLLFFVVVAGAEWPHASVRQVWEEFGHPWSACVTVGALWVKREVNRIMIERERRPITRKRRKSK